MSDSMRMVLVVLLLSAIRCSRFHLPPINLYAVGQYSYNSFFPSLCHVGQSPVHHSFHRDACHVAQAGDTMD
jgi:hypothetical protein